MFPIANIVSVLMSAKVSDYCAKNVYRGTS